VKNLNKKVAVVTGAGSGIGRALAINLAKEGCHLALSDINEAGLRETVDLVYSTIDKSSINISTHKLDVADQKAIFEYADTVVREHSHVDLIINNAGVASHSRIEDISHEDFEWVININMWGVINCTRAFLPFLKLRPEAHIVNIASINSIIGFPANGPYTVSKYAVQGFTETLIQEFRRTNLRISSVHPGGIRTNIANSTRNAPAKSIQTFNKVAATTPDRAAKIIIRGIKRNKEKIFVGLDALLMQIFKRLFPNAAVRIVGFLADKATK